MKKLMNLQTKKRMIPRIIIDEEKCFSDDEYELRKNGLSRMSVKKIRENINKIVNGIISISAEGDTVYIECIGTAGEHFVMPLKMTYHKE